MNWNRKEGKGKTQLLEIFLSFLIQWDAAVFKPLLVGLDLGPVHFW